MPALIPELIAMASDPDVEISVLLRKAKVAARQLQQPEAVSWIDHELQGYPDDSLVPPYRQRRGRLAVRRDGNTYLLPVANTERVQLWQTCPLSLPVSELAALAATGKPLRVHFPPEILPLLMAELGTAREVEISLSAVQVRALIEAVRDRVLDWALALEEASIQGDGMSFTSLEQQQAQQVPSMSIRIGDNANGVQIQLNSPGGQQQQTVTGEQKEAALAALLPWLAQVIDEGKLSPSAQADLQANYVALQALANAPTPSWPVIGALVGSVRAVLEGAGGGVLAAQALGWLATLSGC
ncbi:hypothetical protein KAM385_45730 [Aeromonas hydrophila]|uniref:AbiTii domain-containing protein n=1 Tax=Aeromonas hydrophila TaxID=644 RepID=UPI001CC58069|nr:hypothetical protein [Aeromonas hydrophila]GJC07544.1 hypothetical protein KAM385_45730 [Aeromonas hydrophila]